MSNSQRTFYWPTWNIVDLFADVGGSLCFLKALCILVLGILQYFQGSYNFLMDELFVKAQTLLNTSSVSNE